SQEMQEVMGLSSNQFWLGHFLSALPLTLVDAVIATSVVFLHQAKYRPSAPVDTYRKDGSELPTTPVPSLLPKEHSRQYLRVYPDNPTNTTYLENADPSLVFASFSLFTVLHTLLAFLIACVFPFGRWAMVIGVAVYFLFAACDGDKFSFIFMHSLYVYLSESRTEKLRRAMYPNVAFGTIMKIIGIFDDFEKSAGWDIAGKHALNMDNVTIQEMWLIMGASACVFVFMIGYLSNVLPWATANPQRLFFPLMTFGNVVALNNVSMTIHKFQMTVLLGHNGAGKTTLMNIFTGLLQPDSGKVTVYGFRPNEKEARRAIGFCPQLKGMNSRKIQANVAMLLKTVDLTDKVDALPSQLSGGMKRRLSMAIALVAKPQLLILDEPTVGLDPDTQRVVWKILRDLRGSTTVLLSTNDMEEAEALADRIIVMYSGTLVCWGTPMFLKDACGVGFKIRITKVPNAFSSKEVLSTILKTAPKTTLDDDNDNETVYALHTMGRGGFVGMFRELESGSKSMGIKDIGVSVATMKEAYINRTPIQRFRALVQKRLTVLWRSPFLFITGWILPVFVAYVGLGIIKQSSLDVLAAYQHIDLDAGTYVDADRGSSLKTFMETNKATNTSLGYKVLLESESVPFDVLTDAKGTLMAMYDENFIEYAKAYAFGTIFNGTAIELWSNPTGLVAQGVLRNLIDTVLLRQHTGEASSRIRTGISLYRLTDEELYSEGTQRDPLFGMRELMIYTWAYWGFMGSVCFGLIVASFVVLPSLEVVSEARELQLMTGVSGFLYLFAHFVFDLAFYAVPMTIIFVGYSTISELPSDTQKSLLVTALGFAPLAIFFAYLPSEHSPDGGMAYAIVLGLFAIAGPGVIGGYLMAAFNSGGDFMRLPFVFFPPFAVSATTVRAVNLKYEVAMCDYLRSKKQLKLKHFQFCNHTRYLGETIKHCCDILAKKTSEAWTEPVALSFSPYGILRDVLVMLVMGILLFAYLLYRASGWSQHGREQSTPPASTTNSPEDSDVAAERAAVANICGQQRFGDGSNALVVQELRKVFGNVHAVSGLSFTLKPAECFGLLGVNGAGKTTTFRMLAGLLRLTYGDAYMKDSVLTRDGRKVIPKNSLFRSAVCFAQWQSRLGYCPQVGALLEKLNADETLRLFGRLRGVPEDKLSAVVDNMINTVDLRDHAARMCSYYSVGNRRKLSIAVAMIGFPDVVLLDEPYAGVDVLGLQHIHGELGRIRSTAHVTMMLTSHSMDECEQACDRLCIMVDGALVCLGTPQHIKDKFAKGYKLQFIRYDGASVGPQKLTQSIVDTFPGVTLVDVQWKCIECRTKDKLPLSELFRKIAVLDRHYDLEHVFVSDNTLEQIFIAFARQAQLEKLEKASGDAAPAAAGSTKPTSPPSGGAPAAPAAPPSGGAPATPGASSAAASSATASAAGAS
ncbi:phospholipid-transporting ATPase ABCA7, partial [Rhipicephalus sanguineus]|uniref:phospholipid-transporting ATPase ABCA7 n=1 Tax=Rhipicephalus sanguineus TaxID=34632 RepID=UPI0020C4DCCD